MSSLSRPGRLAEDELSFRRWFLLLSVGTGNEKSAVIYEGTEENSLPMMMLIVANRKWAKLFIASYGNEKT